MLFYPGFIIIIPTQPEEDITSLEDFRTEAQGLLEERNKEVAEAQQKVKKLRRSKRECNQKVGIVKVLLLATLINFFWYLDNYFGYFFPRGITRV